MIDIKTFTFNSFQVNSYILYDQTKEAIIVDPSCENDGEANILFSFIAENNLKPVAVVNTHAHIDHIIGVNRVKSKYAIPFYLNNQDNFLIGTAGQTAIMFGFNLDTAPIVDKFLSEGEKVAFGNSEIELLHVPGHSPGSLVIYAPKEAFIIAGDVLFNGSIGRTDLPGGNHEQLINGIKEKLLNLPSNTKVYCGHGPATTIGKEHDTNPFLI